MNISEGIIRARYRNDDARQQLLERNEAAEYRIRLYRTSYLFKPGHCIRVDISGSYFPRFSRTLNTGEDVATGTRIAIAHQTVLQSTKCPSHILLPGVPRSSWQRENVGISVRNAHSCLWNRGGGNA